MKPQTNTMVDLLLAAGASRASVRRQIAETALGIVHAIRGSRMSIQDAVEDLFTLDNLQAIRRHRLGRDLSEVFEWGMELEDVAELVSGPEALEESLKSIEALAERLLAAPSVVRFKRVSRPRRKAPSSPRSAVA